MLTHFFQRPKVKKQSKPTRTPQKIVSVGEDVEKLKPVHCWWECNTAQPLWKTAWRVLRKLKVELPYDPAIPLLSIHPKEVKAETRMLKFTAALFTIP